MKYVLNKVRTINKNNINLIKREKKKELIGQMYSCDVKQLRCPRDLF